MRRVTAPEALPAALASGSAEAASAFGDGSVYLEREILPARHIEVQLLGDANGRVIALGERDCSLQRRHQKLVEEAPAPFLTDAQREQLFRASVAILREAHYVGAGTCEFLVGADGTVSFLEVNTRLQVEHPVSEEISGIDLVREQLRIAAGEPLGYESVETRGHSLEFRINGEYPAANFLPAPGTGFLGFFSNQVFGTVDVGAGATPNETYTLDNMVSAPVPEPGSATLTVGTALAAAAARLEGVDEASVVAGGVHLVARDAGPLLPRLLEAAEHAGARVTSVEVAEPDLEAVFLHLTGKALRD